jgi:NAD(P)-dependent dehydrogenase (short-subunit alcohol dehydrogenase family)
MTTILITGSTDGIGRETVRQLLARGGDETVVIHARSPERGAPVLADLRAKHPGRRFELATGDFSRLAEVAGLARDVAARFPRLEVLVNNAGVGTVTPRQLTADGHDLTWQINYLAPVLLTDLLLERLIASAPARIVNVSSAGYQMGQGIHFDDLDLARGSYPRSEAYCQSKRAMNMWTFDLADALRGKGVTANCLHPGTYVDTKMVRAAIGTPHTALEAGGRPVLRLAVDPDVAGVTGEYFNMLRREASDTASRDPRLRARLRQATEAALRPFRG